MIVYAVMWYGVDSSELLSLHDTKHRAWESAWAHQYQAWVDHREAALLYGRETGRVYVGRVERWGVRAIPVRSDMPVTLSLLSEVLDERRRQEAKWGPQNHPSFHPEKCTNSAKYAAMLRAETAKARCDAEHREGRGTYASIWREEVAEAEAERTDTTKLNTELIQVAAVSLAWIESNMRNPQ